jgi:gluconolactonase
MGMSEFADVVGTPVVRKLLEGLEFTEGPVWDASDSSVVFSDIPASTLYRWTAEDGLRVLLHPSNKTNGNARDGHGRLISCEHETSRLVRREADGTVAVLADSYGGRPLNSPNDVIVDSASRIYFTDPDFGRTEARMGRLRPVPQAVRGVYRLDSNGALQLLDAGLGAPNGLCLSLDERELFVNDTMTGRIHRIPLSAPDASEVWAEISGEGPGSADGMKLDSVGNLYCTGPGGIHVLDPDARHLGVIPVPEAVGNFTWFGAELRSLFICASTRVYVCDVVTPGR